MIVVHLSIHDPQVLQEANDTIFPNNSLLVHPGLFDLGIESNISTIVNFVLDTKVHMAVSLLEI